MDKVTPPLHNPPPPFPLALKMSSFYGNGDHDCSTYSRTLMFHITLKIYMLGSGKYTRDVTMGTALLVLYNYKCSEAIRKSCKK